MTTPFTTTITAPAKLASQRSIDYFIDLSLDKSVHVNPGVLEDEARADIMDWIGEGRPQDEISYHIDRLRREGYTGRKYRQDAPKQVLDHDLDVPEGRYALPTEDGAINEIAFYHVTHGTGKWEGKIFVARQEGPNERNLGRDGSYRMLRKIAEFGPREASLLYGQHIGRCGVCHLPLTNDLSRELGIGPDCRKKLGW